MVVGLIQLAHKMSRTPSQPPSVACSLLLLLLFPVASCAILLRLLCLSFFLCVYFWSQMWHGLNLGFTSAFFCLLPAALRHCFVYYVFVSFLHTYIFFLLCASL